MGLGQVLVLSATVVAACQAFTQTLAWQAGHGVVLGHPLGMVDLVVTHYPVYSPWQGLGWVWRWGWQAPEALRVPLLVGMVVQMVGVGLVLQGRTRRAKDSADWGTARTVRQQGLTAKHGVVLGAYGGRILRQNGPAHILVVASTQSGKTRGVVIPTLLDWRESVIVNDPKGELVMTTAGWRQTFTKVVSLRPTTNTGSQYNPLDAVRWGSTWEHRDVQMIAQLLADPNGEGHTSDAGRYYGQMSQVLYNAVLRYGHYSGQGRSLGTVWRLLGGKAAGLVARMKQYEGRVEGLRGACQMLTDLTPKGLADVLASGRLGVSLWADPLVDRMTARSDFRLEDVRRKEQPCTIYLGIPFSDQERLMPLSRLIIRQIFDDAVQEGQANQHRLLGMLDEVPGLGYFPMISQGLNYFAGMGVLLVLILPSLLSINDLYGVYHNFIEGCKYRLIFGLNDETVAAKFARMGGMQRVEKARMSRGIGGGQVRRTVSTEEVERPLIGETELMRLPEDEAVLFLGNGVPVRVKKTLYDRNKVWRRRSHRRGE